MGVEVVIGSGSVARKVKVVIADSDRIADQVRQGNHRHSDQEPLSEIFQSCSFRDDISIVKSTAWMAELEISSFGIAALEQIKQVAQANNLLVQADIPAATLYIGGRPGCGMANVID